MKSSYVEERNEGYWITGTRVSLDSIVYTFLDGLSPESTVQAFPVLSLEQVYGAIAYYLANRKKIDKHLQNERADYENKLQSAKQSDPAFYQKIIDAKRKVQVS